MAGAPFRRSVTRITPFPSRRLLTSTSKRHAGASCAIFICRCPVSTDMPAVCQYTPLRFPRPCASSGGATLCSMYCHTAGKEITSEAGEVSSPIRYAPIACSVTPLAETAVQAARQGEGGYWCRSSFLALSHAGQPRRNCQKSVTVRRSVFTSFASGVPPATAYHAAYACGHVPRCSEYLTAHQPVPFSSRRRDFSIVHYLTSGVPPVCA